MLYFSGDFRIEREYISMVDRVFRFFVVASLSFSALFPLLTHPASSLSVKVAFIAIFVFTGSLLGILNVLIARDRVLETPEVLGGLALLGTALSVLSPHGDAFYIAALLQGDHSVAVLSPVCSTVVIVLLEVFRRIPVVHATVDIQN